VKHSIVLLAAILGLLACGSTPAPTTNRPAATNPAASTGGPQTAASSGAPHNNGWTWELATVVDPPADSLFHGTAGSFLAGVNVAAGGAWSSPPGFSDMPESWATIAAIYAAGNAKRICTSADKMVQIWTDGSDPSEVAATRYCRVYGWTG